MSEKSSSTPGRMPAEAPPADDGPVTFAIMSPLLLGRWFWLWSRLIQVPPFVAMMFFGARACLSGGESGAWQAVVSFFGVVLAVGGARDGGVVTVGDTSLTVRYWGLFRRRLSYSEILKVTYFVSPGDNRRLNCGVCLDLRNARHERRFVIGEVDAASKDADVVARAMTMPVASAILRKMAAFPAASSVEGQLLDGAEDAVKWARNLFMLARSAPRDPALRIGDTELERLVASRSANRRVRIAATVVLGARGGLTRFRLPESLKQLDSRKVRVAVEDLAAAQDEVDETRVVAVLRRCLGR